MRHTYAQRFGWRGAVASFLSYFFGRILNAILSKCTDYGFRRLIGPIFCDLYNVPVSFRARFRSAYAENSKCLLLDILLKIGLLFSTWRIFFWVDCGAMSGQWRDVSSCSGSLVTVHHGVRIVYCSVLHSIGVLSYCWLTFAAKIKFIWNYYH